ncbi:MAG TPA: glycosyltransferase [Candidatus Omnitrophica bacterium]|nr:glycosyltransferase [Candidatus Omnitrophota bacterium]
MIKNQNIICISSIDWDFVWQGHQEIMSTFAKNGNRVLFIENTGVRTPTFKDIPRLKKRIVNWFKSVKGFREEADNLFIYSPVVFPFPYSRIFRLINKFLLLNSLRRWMKAVDFHDPVIWTFLPTGTALDIIDNIENKLLVYYCIADFDKLAGSPKKVRRTEDELIRKSDLIFAQGDVLKDKCRRLNDNVHIFPFGVKMNVFESFQAGIDNIPDDITDIKKPIIGYIGGIHRHIDFLLIRFIAEAHPQWSVVLVGPRQTDVSEIADLDNVFLLGKKDFSLLPNYISQFDVGIVPYEISEYTATVFPTKLNEYHAMGKPVVSTQLPEVVNFNRDNGNLVLVAGTHEEFAASISKALNNASRELINKRKDSARANSWSVRIAKMSDKLEEAIEEKCHGPRNWQESFIKFYNVSRKRIIRSAFIVLSLYFLIFYTPLVWFAAEPLKISQAPETADAIVVLAGGVGESGRPSQGYEERVEHAVDLYRKGYAKHIIFSSGYTYVFQEPRVMKALAVSLGVPQEAILLEGEARNTYENIIFTKKIILENGWDEVLIVSSPYHMRRLLLTAKKNASGVKFIYTPILQSRFYSHRVKKGDKRLKQQISLRQIRGLMHEYLAIIYYWWKGYI